jgi:L-threonylcarbamoyladenylate synthase
MLSHFGPEPMRLPMPDDLSAAVAALKRGELVAMPTETVYGLAADARNADAVRRIFAAKGRPADHPLIVHIADARSVSEWAREVPAAAQRLIDAFWPGPLTLVLNKAPQVDPVITGGQDTVGLRQPAHPVARALLSAFGGAVAAPSANRFGRISPTCAQHVRDEFPTGVAVILDGGSSVVGLESTIVDLSGATARLLRPGSISAAAIEALIGPLELPGDAHGPRASGRLAAHYAPGKPLDLVDTDAIEAYRQAHPDGVAWITPGPLPAGGQGIALATDAAGYGQQLYAALRKLDASAARRIAVERPPQDDSWAAVRDRLGRAAVGSGTYNP